MIKIRELKSKKQGMSLSIVLFVIVTIILFITTITLFYLRDKNFNKDTQVSQGSDEVMYKKVLLDFYLTQISESVDKMDNKNVVLNFKTELEKYKLKSGEYVLGELTDIALQVDDKHITIDNGKLKVKFNLDLNYQVTDSKTGVSLDSTKYPYTFSYPLS